MFVRQMFLNAGRAGGKVIDGRCCRESTRNWSHALIYSAHRRNGICQDHLDLVYTRKIGQYNYIAQGCEKSTPLSNAVKPICCLSTIYTGG